MMAANDYHFITHWRVQATVKEVSDILRDATQLPRWWPSVYLEVKQLEPGDSDGVDKVVSLYTKGWLPYTLRWQFRVTESKYPYGFSLEAWGDFVGRGIWTFEQDGEFTNITYDWKLRADKFILDKLSFLMKPIFSANHHWAMERGEQSLKIELERLRAKTPEEIAGIPLPPAPTFPHNLLRKKPA
jgi:hypothetical protein